MNSENNHGGFRGGSYQEMAREFVDIWQKQMVSVATDKQFIQAFLDMFQNLQNMQNAQGKQHQSHNYAANSKTSNSATAHDAGADVLAQLAFRLAMCEKRLAALEGRGGAEKPARRTAQKPVGKPVGKSGEKSGNKPRAAAKRSAK